MLNFDQSGLISIGLNWNYKKLLTCFDILKIRLEISQLKVFVDPKGFRGLRYWGYVWHHELILGPRIKNEWEKITHFARSPIPQLFQFILFYYKQKYSKFTSSHHKYCLIHRCFIAFSTLNGKDPPAKTITIKK